ncbi:hypothetical protein FRC08_009921 [Ceratobasidium sp. 394]|nr:hypothetical protein FRC08_009921 [Ceratobasidium sp. 394]
MPVEVLHVVLLGITKYFWCDAVSRQDNNQRSILIARLNSFNTSGLGTSRLNGKTLVQYAKSLTGGNFRDILQVAPAVLYDLLEPRAYAMWIALCSLAPLVFQPEIHDIDAYMAALEARIDQLLLATVMCNPQWFNKPKFHVLLHLPNHVQQFGPPSLFATETFESYNFVIRLRSIHSNRQAPSADIGRSFSLMHALQHLVSGGYFQNLSMPSSRGEPDPKVPWVQAGPKVQGLLHDKLFLKFMGLSKSANKSTLVFHNCAKHNCSLAKLQPRWQERQVLDSYEDMVQHSVKPNDLVLNLSQLRSAETLHNFYPNVSPAYPTLDDAITDGLEHQAQLEHQRQANQEAKEVAAKERARKKEEKEEQQAKRQKTSS